MSWKGVWQRLLYGSGSLSVPRLLSGPPWKSSPAHPQRDSGNEPLYLRHCLRHLGDAFYSASSRRLFPNSRTLHRAAHQAHEVAVVPDVAGQLAVEPVFLHAPLWELLSIHDPAAAQHQNILQAQSAALGHALE